MNTLTFLTENPLSAVLTILFFLALAASGFYWYRTNDKKGREILLGVLASGFILLAFHIPFLLEHHR